jgi:urease accessory protein
MSDGGLPLPLLVWLSPSFPTGAFAYSHGLEWAVDNGQIHNSRTLREWLADLCSHGALRTDAVLLMSAYRAAMAQDWNELRAVNDLALALAPSRERLLETSTQGDAFFTAVLASWPAPGLVRFSEILREDDLAYPVAVGLAAGAHQIAAWGADIASMRHETQYSRLFRS